MHCNELFHDPVPKTSNESEIYFMGPYHRVPAWRCSHAPCCVAQSRAYNFTDSQRSQVLQAETAKEESLHGLKVPNFGSC